MSGKIKAIHISHTYIFQQLLFILFLSAITPAKDYGGRCHAEAFDIGCML